MGASDSRVVARPAWRSYLLLSRISNLPTVWTNVMAGIVAAGAPVRAASTVPLAVAASLFYVGGMFLNDAFDRRFDAVRRADRPIPAGDVSVPAVFTLGFALLAGGEACLAWAGFMRALPLGAMLALAIVVYDAWHKGNPIGPLIMGACRGLVYAVAAAAVAGTLSARAIVAAVVVTAYVAVVTLVAKQAGPRIGPSIPWLIAGISLVDGAVILSCGGGAAAAAFGVVGFALTLLAQRVVPGT